MVSPQPIQLWQYLSVKRNILNNNLKRLFYLSWEDAFWDLLDKKNIKKNSIILVPEFFCGDVEKNIENHGFKIEHYKILKNLKVDIFDFNRKLSDVKPNVVIIFNAIGIKSNINIDKISNHILVVEDCVHQTIDLSKVNITRKNHFIIDSLRKVIPLQGSNLIGRKLDLDFKSPNILQSLSYSLKVHILWVLMIICWNLNKYSLAEKLMIDGYDLIGDNKLPAKGFWIFYFLSQFLNIHKIECIKTKQVEIYKEYIKSDIYFLKSDYKNLRGYPVKVNQTKLNYLRQNNIFVRFELTDSTWGNKNNIIYLPMGPHVSYDKIHKICKIYQSESLIQV